MNTKGIQIILFLIIFPLGNNYACQSDTISRNSFSFDITTGLQGSLSFAQAGVNYAPQDKFFWFGAKLRGMSSITWVTFINMETNNSVSFHPTILAGVFTMGGSSKMREGSCRVYGYSELMLGKTFTPYDSYFYNTPNLIGKNLTYGVFGIFGIEFFSSEKVSLIIESGGGFKSIRVEDKENQYAVASSWIGSGVTFRMGTIIYLNTE